jgi:hypothetical protein
MEIENSKPEETVVPESVTAPVANTPEALVPIVDLASSVAGTSTPKASPSTGGLGAGATSPAVKATVAVTPAPVSAVKTELPKTTGQTVGGWNRFAGYNPNAAKNKPKDGRGGPGRK